jgi:uroporphyrinogen decarboxylase
MVLSHQEMGAVPYEFTFSPPIERRLVEHYGSADLDDVLDFPIRFAATKTIKPIYASPADFGETAVDEFGVVWATSDLDRGVPIGPCLLEPDLDGYRFPDPSAPYRYEDLGDWCEDNDEHYRVIWIGDFFERATFMRSMEGLLTDLIANPRFVEELLRGIADYILETTDVLFDRFTFEGVALSDDYGTQRGMMMSPSHWRRFVKPFLREIYDHAKNHGRTVLHHSCGDFYPIIGDLIDMGLDILHPIQPESMDGLKLKQEFGRDVTLCGGLRSQDLLPRGTPEDVCAEVRRLKREMGRGGGYILGPGLTVQADVPMPNLLAALDEAREGSAQVR